MAIYKGGDWREDLKGEKVNRTQKASEQGPPLRIAN